MSLTPFIALFPFLGFVLLAVFGRWMSKTIVAIVGVCSVGLSAVAAFVVGYDFLTAPPANHIYTQTIWQWIHVGTFSPTVAFRIDPLSLVMILVITFVSFLIHLYSSEFMEEDRDYKRFFAYLNLFVGSMVVLVLADNLLLTYLGWEGVGLCSYLLIGFWYKDPVNAGAAIKAFVVTRVGDAAFAIALFILYIHFGTLNVQQLSVLIPTKWAVGSSLATLTGLLLLGGAVGKSAQLPLQTWLPDAMAGPTPVSALIHSSTMVTAGVYLIARMNVIYSLSPTAQGVVAFIGAATLLVAGFSAMTQHDIKRILAYSTISQIGYMVLALGVGAYSAAMFHFMTHAFFKALLFLGAGVMIHCLNDEHSIFNMGGLRKLMPVVFWTFLFAGASLSALPLVTAGFYSKDLIIWSAWASQSGSPWLWGAGVFGAFITAIYTFRMIFVAFFGEAKIHPHKGPGFRMSLPLVVLGVLSIIAGFVETPETLGNVTVFSRFMNTILPEAVLRTGVVESELLFQILTVVIVLIGVYLAYHFYLKNPAALESLTAHRPVEMLKAYWQSGWGFDWLYDRLFIRPYFWIAGVNKSDAVDLIYRGVAKSATVLHDLVSETQTGRVRNYAAAIAIGAVVFVALVMYL